MQRTTKFCGNQLMKCLCGSDSDSNSVSVSILHSSTPHHYLRALRILPSMVSSIIKRVTGRKCLHTLTIPPSHRPEESLFHSGRSFCTICYYRQLDDHVCSIKVALTSDTSLWQLSYCYQIDCTFTAQVIIKKEPSSVASNRVEFLKRTAFFAWMGY